MTASDVLQYLYQEIHTIVAATVDEEGLPVTCAIDIMDTDENGLYILTAKGKAFYNRMKSRGFIAMTGLKGTDTMSCVAVSLRGKVKELGSGPLSRLLKKILIWRRFTLLKSHKGLSQFSRSLMEAESGLTFQKSLSSVFPLHLGMVREIESATLLLIFARDANAARQFVRKAVLIFLQNRRKSSRSTAYTAEIVWQFVHTKRLFVITWNNPLKRSLQL